MKHSAAADGETLDGEWFDVIVCRRRENYETCVPLAS